LTTPSIADILIGIGGVLLMICGKCTNNPDKLFSVNMKSIVCNVCGESHFINQNFNNSICSFCSRVLGICQYGNCDVPPQSPKPPKNTIIKEW
jgi:hypothetical protein